LTNRLVSSGQGKRTVVWAKLPGWPWWPHVVTSAARLGEEGAPDDLVVAAREWETKMPADGDASSCDEYEFSDSDPGSDSDEEASHPAPSHRRSLPHGQLCASMKHAASPSAWRTALPPPGFGSLVVQALGSGELYLADRIEMRRFVPWRAEEADRRMTDALPSVRRAAGKKGSANDRWLAAAVELAHRLAENRAGAGPLCTASARDELAAACCRRLLRPAKRDRPLASLPAGSASTARHDEAAGEPRPKRSCRLLTAALSPEPCPRPELAVTPAVSVRSAQGAGTRSAAPSPTMSDDGSSGPPGAAPPPAEAPAAAAPRRRMRVSAQVAMLLLRETL